MGHMGHGPQASRLEGPRALPIIHKNKRKESLRRIKKVKKKEKKRKIHVKSSLLDCACSEKGAFFWRKEL